MHRIEGVEWFAELAFGCFTAHKARVFVEVMVFIRLATLIEIVVIICSSQLFSQFCDACISQSIFQTFSNSFVFGVEIARQIAIFLEQSHSTLIAHSRSFSSLEHLILIHIKAFQSQVDKHRDARVAHHAICFVAHEMPNRQFALLFVDMQHGLSDVALLFGMNNGH